MKVDKKDEIVEDEISVSRRKKHIYRGIVFFEEACCVISGGAKKSERATFWYEPTQTCATRETYYDIAKIKESIDRVAAKEEENRQEARRLMAGAFDGFSVPPDAANRFGKSLGDPDFWYDNSSSVACVYKGIISVDIWYSKGEGPSYRFVLPVRDKAVSFGGHDNAIKALDDAIDEGIKTLSDAKASH
jgi:hypothetical protein